LQANRIRVLIVDDDEPVVRTLQMCLEAMQRYTVCVETDATQALATAQQFRPDVVLLDVIMPQRGGADVLQEFRGEAGLERVPVLFLTATPFRSAVVPDGWIAKPATATEVARQIEAQVSGFEYR
jgi:CheY-like chemotaxis protein